MGDATTVRAAPDGGVISSGFFFLHPRDEGNRATEGGIDLRSEEPTGAYWMSKKALVLDMMGED